jgi:hypothetical protein
MTIPLRVLLAASLLACPVAASAQIVESVGTRAVGMGGAFVAVGTDSTATWWNPAAQAAGPFVDVSLGSAVTELTNQLPASRDRTSWFALETPPIGFSYYRYRVSDAATPTAQDRASRQDGGTGVPIRSVSVSQFGFSLAQTLLPGVHAGTTLKYVRGTARTGAASGSGSDLLDAGDDLSGGDAHGQFDLDIGVIAVGGPMRLGAVMRNVREPDFALSAVPGAETIRLPRQLRVGAAYDAEQAGSDSLVVAVDADVKTYEVATGDRRVIALGAEQWLFTRRFAVRGGVRFNTVGLKERAATAGASVALRSGLYLEGAYVGGGTVDERGWSTAARVSF